MAYVSDLSLTQVRGIPIMPQIGMPFTQGNVWHVKPSSGNDGNSGLDPDHAFKTLSHAQAAAVANQNDIVLLYQESNTAGSTTDYQSTALLWAKDGVHLIGVGASPMIGSRSRIAQTSTVKSLATLITLSANNCLLANLEIYKGVASSTASTPRALLVSGMRNKIVNCQISGIGDTSEDVTGAASLSVTGDENQFVDCYIGSDTVIRATAESEVLISGTRNQFERCKINSYTSSTTYKAITVAVGSFHTATWLNNCILSTEPHRTSGATVTGAILHGDAAAGEIFMNGGGVFGYANISTITDGTIWVLAGWGLGTHSNFPGIARGQQTS